ncbi:MAG TPA: hypothetical protein VNL73_03925 [Verrucomicrobiae bacterium]|nr:hypothetical protein [Verrucomicrobiae bacterium]
MKQKSLNARLRKTNLTVFEARDGLVESFCLTNRTILDSGKITVKHDQKSCELDRMTEALAKATFREVGGDYHMPTLENLYKVKDTLEAKLKLAARPQEIYRRHQTACQQLLEKASIPVFDHAEKK